MLTDEELVGCHVALTPTWTETAWFADYVLPMGLGAERHDVASYETHAGRWIGFRQPVLRASSPSSRAAPSTDTCEVNPGEVWEENEFWIELSWRIDPDGSLGIRQYFESPARPGRADQRRRVLRHLFEHSVPGLPRGRRGAGHDAAGVHAPPRRVRDRRATSTQVHERTVAPRRAGRGGAQRGDDGVYRVPGTAGCHDRLEDVGGHMPFIGDGSVGVEVDGVVRTGFPTPSRKLELYSRRCCADWGWPEYALPDLHPPPRPLAGPRLRGRRAHPHPDVPPADA